MDNKYDISIIIPAYNLEKYIEGLLDYLINQTIFSQLEIIIINDGSTDKTKDICQQYIDKYNNILFITQENKGVSSARNRGILLAKGRYVLFIDGDDQISLDYCERLLDIAKSNDVDIVITDVVLRSALGDLTKSKYKEDTVYSDMNQVLKKLFIRENVTSYSVGKLFKREILSDCKFNTSISIGEDLLFVYESIKKSQKILINTYVADYYYIERENSATNSIFSNKNLDLLKVMDIILTKEKYNEELYRYIYSLDIIMKNDCLDIIIHDKVKYQYKLIYKECLSQIRKYPLLKNKRYLSRNQFIRLFLTKISPYISLKVSSTIYKLKYKS